MIIQHRGFVLRQRARRPVDPTIAAIWIGIPAAGWILIAFLLYRVLA